MSLTPSRPLALLYFLTGALRIQFPTGARCYNNREFMLRIQLEPWADDIHIGMLPRKEPPVVTYRVNDDAHGRQYKGGNGCSARASHIRDVRHETQLAH